jgi:hypothetical protein
MVGQHGLGIFEAADLRAEKARHARRPDHQAELAGTRAALGKRRAASAAICGPSRPHGLPESTCADRLTELEIVVELNGTVDVATPARTAQSLRKEWCQPSSR